jgi:hypothetical protein
MDQDHRTKEWNAIQRALEVANATIQQLEAKVEEEAIAREFEAVGSGAGHHGSLTAGRSITPDHSSLFLVRPRRRLSALLEWQTQLNREVENGNV